MFVLNGQNSSVYVGVPQGHILGPVCFWFILIVRWFVLQGKVFCLLMIHQYIK